jgi:hypothetical protein
VRWPVEITDETGKPISGAAVSFHLPEDGPGGTFASGLRTDLVSHDRPARPGDYPNLAVQSTPGAFSNPYRQIEGTGSGG